MTTYKVTLDSEKSILTELPEINAATPKEAAEKYLGRKVLRSSGRSARIVIQSSKWPYKMYLYDEVNA